MRVFVLIAMVCGLLASIALAASSQLETSSESQTLGSLLPSPALLLLFLGGLPLLMIFPKKN
jgi:hypothetical protein